VPIVKFNPKDKHKALPPSLAAGALTSHWIIILVLVGLTSWALSPTLHGDFLYWDDYDNLVENPAYRGLGWSQIQWMFTTFHMSLYRPLTWLTLGLDYLLWGTDPFGYHLTNLLLHLANAILFYGIAFWLLSLTLARETSAESARRRLRLAAGFAALVFAVHPLRVESVAWVSARNDVLSALFYLLTIIFYLQANLGARSRPGRRKWLLSAAFVACLFSLLSKAIGMSLPLILLLLDVYPLRRIRTGEWLGPTGRKILLEKTPFFLLALVVGWVALVAKREAGALATIELLSWDARIYQVVYSLAFYLRKTVLPLNLSPLYPTGYLNPLSPSFLMASSAVGLLTLCFVVFRRRWPAALAVWCYYLIVLAPVSGVAQSGPQIVADRYSYLSCLGWALLAGGALFFSQTGGRFGRDGLRALAGACAAGVIVIAGFLSWRQAHVWRDDGQLWRHALSVAPESSIAHLNLGNFLDRAGDFAQAARHLRHAVELEPSYARAHYSLGLTLVNQGDLAGAEAHLFQAVDLAPGFAKAHNNLGNVLALQGKIKEAQRYFFAALALDPRYSRAHYNLSQVLIAQGNLADAVGHLREAVRAEPNYVAAQLSLGAALTQKGDLDEAILHLRAALGLRPDAAEIHEAIGRALALQGDKEAAVGHLEEAIRIIKTKALPERKINRPGP
jgi:Flp pilus assembly protein TadD